MSLVCVFGTSLLLFCIGLIGILTRRNIIIVLLSIELMLTACNISFVAGSRLVSNIDGEIIVLFTIAISAAEAALGLSLAILWARLTGTTDIDSISLLRG
ncbi:MAG: NADH-quinone oxidoreductase subunit NuoK [Candidatus Hydrogenedentota bacterium]